MRLSFTSSLFTSDRNPSRYCSLNHYRATEHPLVALVKKLWEVHIWASQALLFCRVFMTKPEMSLEVLCESSPAFYGCCLGNLTREQRARMLTLNIWRNAECRDFYFNSMHKLAFLYHGKPNGCPIISRIRNSCSPSVAHNLNPIRTPHEA